MTNRIQLASTAFHLREGSTSSTVAYWTEDNFHVQQLRNSIMIAISAGDAAQNAREQLVELISDAITDSLDVDWTSEAAANSVVDAILDTAAPLFDESDKS